MTAGDWIFLFVAWEGWWLCIYIFADMARFALADIKPARYIGDKQESKTTAERIKLANGE